MSGGVNEAIVKRFVEAANAVDLDALAEVLTPELEHRWRQSLHGAFAGHIMSIKSMLSSGDHVVVRIATSGLHTREWHGIPASNKPWANEGVYFIRISEGRIVELETLFNELDRVKQLGGQIVPPKTGTN